MNISRRKALVLRVSRGSLSVLAVALALGVAGVSTAQGASGAAKSAPKASAAAAQEAAPSSKGMNTAIKVHGHWTIEVRNPDGKVVTHREFENSLAYGGAIFANLLGGTATPGGLAIVLGGSVCPAAGYATSLNWIGGYGNIGDNTCAVVVAGSAMAASSPLYLSANANENEYVGYLYEYFNSGEVFKSDNLGCGSSASICSPTLTVSPSAGGGSLTLSGTYPAPSNAPAGAYIDGVAVTGYTCSPTATIAGCQNPPSQGGTVPVTLYGNWSSTFAGFTLEITGTGLSPTIPVAAGQTIAATVVLSFQ